MYGRAFSKSRWKGKSHDILFEANNICNWNPLAIHLLVSRPLEGGGRLRAPSQGVYTIGLRNIMIRIEEWIMQMIRLQILLQ